MAATEKMFWQLIGIIILAAGVIFGIIVAVTGGKTVSRETLREVGELRKLTVLESNDVEFRKCIVEGHEYWFAWAEYKGGPIHSASCPCHTNNQIRLKLQ